MGDPERTYKREETDRVGMDLRQARETQELYDRVKNLEGENKAPLKVQETNEKMMDDSILKERQKDTVRTVQVEPKPTKGLLQLADEFINDWWTTERRPKLQL